MRKRRPTSTSAFGVGRRESHDATDFYARFSAPDLSDDHEVRATPPGGLDRIYAHDARDMPELEDASVALVVTSPPYFAGKEYEEALGEGHIPASYLDYLEMLRDVFATCVDKLEPGGRIAVNVANLGRKPYRSLSADVIGILQDDLGLLLRGEILWWKARGAAGSCAWGSFRSPANPVLRDLTERVVVASKGRFDRALAGPERARNRLPSEATISKDEFMEATTDVWEIPAESATRVGHPAPFPVELPQRLVELYTYRGDVVLDPFMGSGSTAVAALRTGRRFVGYDTDPGYVDAAMRRVEAERARLDTRWRPGRGPGARARVGTRVRVRPIGPSPGVPSSSTSPRPCCATAASPRCSPTAGAGASRSSWRSPPVTGPGRCGTSTCAAGSRPPAPGCGARMSSGVPSAGPGSCGPSSASSPRCSCSRPTSPTGARRGGRRCAPPGASCSATPSTCGRRPPGPGCASTPAGRRPASPSATSSRPVTTPGDAR
ncbi:MAG: DNA methyltransferase [Acidimicrobiia bacterium]|nr:DNA methyltransferase [Acidimicrobiia bacterium]